MIAVTQRFLPQLRVGRPGRIINIGASSLLQLTLGTARSTCRSRQGNRTAAAVPASSGRSLCCCAAAPMVLAAFSDATAGCETGTSQSPFVLRRARTVALPMFPQMSAAHAITIRMNSPVVPLFEYKMMNAGSQSGTVALPMFAPYACSKFGVEALSDCLRLELAGQVGGLSLHAIKESVQVHHPGAPTEHVSRAPLASSILAWQALRARLVHASESAEGRRDATMPFAGPNRIQKSEVVLRQRTTDVLLLLSRTRASRCAW